MIKNWFSICTLVLFCNQVTTAFSQCVAAGPRNPTVFTNDATIGTIAWTLPSNVAASDDVRSTAGAAIAILSSSTTNYLLETGFGFSIPSTASICGIQVEIERRQQGVLIGSSVKDNSVKIIKNGVIVGTSEHASGANWPGADAYTTYGSSTDLWGTTWTPANINAANFGIAYASASLNAGLASLFLSAEIDHMRLTVFYNNILPIELTNFSALCNDNGVELKWTTASQINNDYFTIERTKDGINFEEVEIIDGAGNANKIMNYSFVDYHPYEGILYYRLKQTDFDGQYDYSQLISVECNNDRKLPLFPNPSSGVFTIQGQGNLIVYNVVGEEIYSLKNISDKQQIDLSAYSKGIYFYQLQSSGELILSGKLIIE